MSTPSSNQGTTTEETESKLKYKNHEGIIFTARTPDLSFNGNYTIIDENGDTAVHPFGEGMIYLRSDDDENQETIELTQEVNDIIRQLIPNHQAYVRRITSSHWF